MSVFDIDNLTCQAPQAQKKPLVLLVDDEVENLKMLSYLLTGEFDLLTARDGFEAIELLDDMRDSKAVQVVISDQRMTNMTGLEFLKKVNHLLPDAILIMVSGTINTKHLFNTIEQAGIFRLLTKPIDPAELLQSVHQGIAAWQLRQELLAKAKDITLEIQVISEELAVKKMALVEVRDNLPLVSIGAPLADNFSID
jgi:response regulator RpfG family c-di-GMP phosphodiesterase